MNYKRISTILLYSWFHLKHSMESWVDLVWFPLVNLILFGFIGNFLSSANASYIQVLVFGLIFWEVARISQYSVSVSLMWDVWYESFSTIFITPVSVEEFLIGHGIGGVIKSLGVFMLLSLFANYYYHVSILILGWPLLIYLLGLLWFGWIMGVFIVGMIFRYGKDIASTSWGLIYLFQPLSAIFYPVEALPMQIRWLSYLSPITYLMESVRHQFNTGEVLWNNIIRSFILSGLYFLVSYGYMHFSHLKARDKGSFDNLDF